MPSKFANLKKITVNRLRAQLAGSLLGFLLVLLSAVWAFIELTEEVIEGETRSFDTRILLMLRHPLDRGDPIGPEWLEIVGRDVTALGGVALLTLLTLASAGYLRLKGQGRTMSFLLVSVVGGVLVSQAIKLGVDRPRPDLVAYGTQAYSASFPSGHAMMATIVYLTLATLMSRVEPARGLRVYFFAIAILITFLVGLSRVYLGVHWPTDVLAGWTAGTAWAFGCWIIARWLAARGTLEAEPGTDQDALKQ